MLPGLRLAEHGRIPTDCKYTNPRIKYDGINWWITVGIEYKDNARISSNEGIGIDLGIKDLAICSDGNKYRNINKTQRVKKLEKRKCRLQRSISRGYEKNKKGENNNTFKLIQMCTDTLVRNLRLWSVQELVSRYCRNTN